MKILVIGEPVHFNECKLKFGSQHELSHADNRASLISLVDKNDIVFDFLIDEEPETFEDYRDKKAIVFLNTCKITLRELQYSFGAPAGQSIFGFNGLPTFFNRPVLEVSLLNDADKPQLENACSRLGTEFQLVDDRVGLVTPRVICMIINEAYYTVQEGTATREAIDVAMKLGTNYPMGPFEWCEKIGIKHVYELLEAVYEDTRDERYKICPLLKKEYLTRTPE